MQKNLTNIGKYDIIIYKGGIIMGNILIATTNQDKFNIISTLLNKIGFNQFQFYNLKMLNLTSTIIETGSIEDRAKQKAYEFKSLTNTYTAIIGIDDGILLPTFHTIDTELKKVLKQIIYDKILQQNDIVYICRSFYFITPKKEYSIFTKIPFIYHNKENIEIKPNSYPLSQLLSPIDSTQFITELTQDEEMDYYMKYCQDKFNHILADIKKY